jgi:Fe-S-cluster containining protein
MNQDLFTNYRNLLSKVDDFSSWHIQTYQEHFACHYGCADCCKQDLHLLPVEFHFLQKAFTLLPENTKQIAIRSRTNSTDRHLPCPLLHKGGCLLYVHRPVICRTHGLPLYIMENGEEKRDCCPRNFVRLSLEHLPITDLLDLKRLNTLLVAVNTVFARQVGVKAGVRLPLSRLGHLDPHNDV